MIGIEQHVTTSSAYYTDRGRFKTGPVFNRNRVWEGDTIMVYDYERKKHMEAQVTRVDPDTIYFIMKHDKSEGTYSSTKAHEIVKGTNLPHVYLKR